MPSNNSRPSTTTAARVRAAQRHDLPALTAIENACFTGDRLSARSFARLLSGPTARTLVAEVDGTDTPVGYGLVLLRRGSSLARLYSIAVLPDAAGRGIAGALLAATEAAALEAGRRTMSLEVEAGNARALALYRTRGYTLRRRLPTYYEGGLDGLRLARALDGPIADTPPTRDLDRQPADEPER